MTPSDSSYPAPADSEAYEAGLTTVGDFDTVESYCRYFNWLKSPSKLELNSNYHQFKSGIKPMWEDEANVNGGKCVLTMKNNCHGRVGALKFLFYYLILSKDT